MRASRTLQALGPRTARLLLLQLGCRQPALHFTVPAQQGKCRSAHLHGLSIAYDTQWQLAGSLDMHSREHWHVYMTEIYSRTQVMIQSC